MKGYLVLSNGCVLDGVVSDKKQNIVGDIVFGKDNLISIAQKESSNNITLSKSEFDNFENKFKGSKLTGKIVVDELPLEYHMYDLQSSF